MVSTELMALPPRLQHRLLHLKSLNRLALWGLVGGGMLLTVAGPQYLHSSQGLGSYESTRDSAALEENAASQTSEEQTASSEIDDLSLLLNQLQPHTSSLPDSSQTLDELSEANPDRLQLPTPAGPNALPEPEPSTLDSPFADYLARTQLQARPAPIDRYPQTGSGSVSFSDSNPASSSASADPLEMGQNQSPLSPLERALSQQGEVNSSQSPESQASRQVNEPDSTDTSDQPFSWESDQPHDPWLVEHQPAGISQSFIRTTPQMSPPPGTTGYALPPGSTPDQPVPVTPQFPSPAVPAAPPVEVNLRPSAPSSPFSAGTTAPVVPQPSEVEPGYVQPQPLPEPEPFTVPRPPGSYTGGGYIYTFSDPNSPAQ